VKLEIRAVVAHVQSVRAEGRAQLARRLRSERRSGLVIIETCHRVELYAHAADVGDIAGEEMPRGTEVLTGTAAARHLLRLAVGLESAVLAEDQLLHQLRAAIQQARGRGRLSSELDRLLDTALRTGRRARSWLPARRKSLTDVALERVIGRTAAPGGEVLVVGTGEMGRRAAHVLRARGGQAIVTSRTPERAAALAAEVNARPVSFDPGAQEMRRLAGAVIALAGPWPISEATARALLDSSAWVVDLSAPPAVAAGLARRLGRRLISIDDLTLEAGPPPSRRLVARLDELVEQTLAEYVAWYEREAQRGAARALNDRAAAARSAELNALWQRLPALDRNQRAEVESMARRLTQRLLRDPLEQLNQDDDDRHASAARELFRL